MDDFAAKVRNKAIEVREDIRMKTLRRSASQRMIAGVCGGIAEYFNIDPTIVRLLWALFAFTGVGAIAYFVAAVIIPGADGR